MAAGNVADAVGHGDDDKTECQCRGEVRRDAALRRASAGDDRRAAGKDDQYQRADEFGNVLFYRCHENPPFICCIRISIAEISEKR